MASEFIDRPPRIQPELPIKEIPIPNPPEKPGTGAQDVMSLLIPLLSIVGFAAFAGSGNLGPALAMGGVMMLSSLLSFYTAWKQNQGAGEKQKVYLDSLKQLRQEMSQHHNTQRIFFAHNYPDVGTLLNVAAYKEAGQETSRFGTRLWERRTDDHDFGVIRLGMGTRNSTVVYTLNSSSDDNPLNRDARKLADDSRVIADAPVTLSLRQKPQTLGDPTAEDKQPKVHGAAQSAIGIFGKNSGQVEDFARAVTAHIAAFHSPVDARLYVVGNPDRKSEWKFAEWLPHCSTRGVGEDDETNDDKEFDQLCFSDENDDIITFWKRIKKELDQRQLRLKDSKEGEKTPDVSIPLLVVVVDLLGVTPKGSTLGDVAGEATVSRIVKMGKVLGAAIFFLADDVKKIPSDCDAMIEIGQVGERVVFRYAEIGLNTTRYLGDADRLDAQTAQMTFAAKIRRLDMQRPFGSDLPRAVTLLQMLSVVEKQRLDSVDKLPIEQHWRRSIDPRAQDWLKAPVGMKSMRDPREIYFTAKEGGDGVHGVVAGTTGSGKSEMLMTLIGGMALRYDPRIVNFVLVDYKGGQAFESFRALPHTVDILTNLQPNAIERMFVAIQAVMDQRAEILAKSGVSDLVKYRAEVAPKLEADDPRPRTFPHLFIIVDEFAEMIQANPDYKSKFESVTRLGRAFGVSLILATQRPAGAVTDQMRANMKLKICLRVETSDDSKELLGDGEAAFLPNIGGRGFVKSGNELMEGVQMAWAGEKYTGEQKVQLKDLYWLDKDENAEPMPDLSKMAGVLYTPGEMAQALGLKEPPRVLLDWVVGAMAIQARRLNVPLQTKPWPNPLPDQLSLSSPVDARYLNTERDDVTSDKTIVINEAVSAWLNKFQGQTLWPTFDWHAPIPLRADIGLVDNPYRAENRLLSLDVASGPTVLFGAAGRGKTTFIKSLLLALAAARTPNELHLYALDFGRGGLKSIAALPHLGASIDASEPARVEQLLRMLRNFVNERQEQLGKSPYGTLNEYNANTPTNIYPDIVCVVDNFAEFKESYEHLILDLMALIRDGRQFGVHVVLTANTVADIGGKLLNILTNKLTVSQSDTLAYADIVGSGARPFDNVPGRGLIAIALKEGDKPMPLEFHVGVPGQFEAVTYGMEPAEKAAIGARNAENLNQNYITIARHMQEVATALGYKRPAAELPKSLTLLDMWSKLDKHEVRSISELNLAEKWRGSLLPENQEWLRGPVGLISDKDVKQMVFQAQADGVHGMAAGTTGSGKSELLQTLIASMAILYDPRIVNFVLIDYKGGPTVEPFKQLPHAVDIATNLDGNAVERIFIAIDAEMRRRSAILAKAQVADLVEYRKKVVPTLKPDSPFPKTFPHLFIIVDEFAEMIQVNPDYRAKFESITRLGRSFGVSLILAAQRPAGAVTDQMRSNMKFRISLRVETPQDSKELLGRPDAARLPQIAGRGYVQAGGDLLTEVQAAWSGAPYTGDKDDSAFPPALVLKALSTEAGKEAEPPRSVLGWLVGSMAAEAVRSGVPKQSKPWPDPLPAKLPINLPIDATYMPEEGAAKDAVSARKVRQMVLSPALARWASLTPPPSDGGGWEGAWQHWHWRDKLPLTATFGVIDNPFEAEQTPLSINVVEPLLVFGASGRGKTTFVKSLLFALCAERSPAELNIYALDFGRGALKAVGALPHCGAAIDSAKADRIEALFRMVRGIMGERQEQLAKFASLEDYNAQNVNNPEALFPAIIFVIDNFAEFKETFEYLIPDLMSLVRDGRQFGLHFVITANTPQDLGGKLMNLFNQRVCFTMSDAGMIQDVVGRPPLPLTDMPGRGFIPVMMDNRPMPLEFQVAVPDMGAEKDPYLRIAERMELARAAAGFKRPSAEIPKTVTLMEMHQAMYLRKVDRLGDLNIAENWKQSMLPQNQDWLEAKIGFVSSKELRGLYFTAKAGGDGVHGLAAGTTGSGKSELVQTLISAMAIKYDPRIVNFVLIDYKGGPTVEPFRKLPHVVDIATNLDGNAVERIFVAIGAEMNRRSAILAQSGVADLVEYRKKVIPTLKPDSPFPRTFPHLFIIVDEFAEMITQNPDYKQKFESITRLGRSFGVSLILATQKPSGVVTDQMKANMKFRMCLRLETADDSKELLGRPDAATLPSIAGRGYAQVGGSGLVEFQAAYSGGPYDDLKADPVYPSQEILKALGKEDDPPRSLLGWLVGATALEAQRQKIAKQFKPWPDLLPTHLPIQDPFNAEYMPDLRDKGQKTVVINPQVAAWLDDLENTAAKPLWQPHNFATRLPVRASFGVVDNTWEAEQKLLDVDVTNDALLVFGASGRGKTSFVKSFVLALAAQYLPTELHIFALDFGRGGLKALRNLPHVGGIVDGNDDDRIERLFRLVRNTIDERQRKLAAYDDFDDYNAKNTEAPLTSVLVVIDNVVEFKETYDKYLPDLLSLVRDGRAFGVYFLMTAALMNDAPNKLFGLVTQKATFYQADYTDYQGILGKRGVSIPDVVGRGLIMGEVGGTPYPLEFHVALPFRVSRNDKGEKVYQDITRDLAARMQQAWQSVLAQQPELKARMPKPIEPLATTIDLGELLPEMASGTLPLRAPLGINDNDRETALIELDKTPHWLVVGPPMAGKTTTLRTAVLSIAHTYSPEQVALVLMDPSDSARRFFNFGSSDGRSLAQLPHVLMTVSNGKELDELILRLRAEFDEDLIRKLTERPDVYAPVDNGKRIILLMCDHYDDWESLERGSTRGGLGALAEIGKGKNLHIVLAGSLSILSGGTNALRKRAESARHALVLQDVDTVRYMGVRGQFTTKDMPSGRGYLIRGLTPSLVQVAMPVVDGQGGRSGEEQLGERLSAIEAQYWSKARWSYAVSEMQPLEEILSAAGEAANAPTDYSTVSTMSGSNGTGVPGQSITPDTSDAMKQLEELMKGMALDTTAELSFASVEIPDDETTGASEAGNP